MTDRELLELAAKAAGIEISEWVDGEPMKREGDAYWMWNPLTDDGDALRLETVMKIELYYTHAYVIARNTEESNPVCMYNDDPYAATRRAIVLAAAEIGKGMK